MRRTRNWGDKMWEPSLGSESLAGYFEKRPILAPFSAHFDTYGNVGDILNITWIRKTYSVHILITFMYLSINILLRGRIRNMFQEKQEYYLSELQSNLIALALIAVQILIPWEPKKLSLVVGPPFSYRVNW